MLEQTQVEKLTDQLSQIVMARLDEDKLVVPALPAVAERCLATLKKPTFDAKVLVSQLEADPVLSAMVLREASSALNGGCTKMLDRAVARVGAARLKAIVTSYATHLLFESSDPKIRNANKQVWEHSLATALLARDLAAFAGDVDGDLCYLAGLLHDVGKPVLSSMLLEAERKMANDQRWIEPKVWLEVIAANHRPIGVAVATRWNLPPAVAAAIRDCQDYNAAERNCAPNVVRLANAVAKREGFNAGVPADDDVHAMIMVGRSMLGIEDDVIAGLAANLKPRIAQVTE